MIEGTLKKFSTGKLMNKYHYRYFILKRDGILQYSKESPNTTSSPTKRTKTKEINLKNACTVKIGKNPLTVTFKEEKGGSCKLKFTSADEMEIWMESFNKLMK